MTALYIEFTIGVVGFLLFSVALYNDSKSKENWPGIIFFSLFFLYLVINSLLVLFHYRLVIGKTAGTYRGRKGGTYISYVYTYENVSYKGSNSYESGLKTEGGYYYVRISKLFPKVSTMDFSKPVKDKKKVDSLQFIEFADLVLKRTYIPRTTFAKFINVDDSQLYHERSKYFGKTIIYYNGYKLIYLRQNDGLKGHEILVTFDQLNQQIDVKTFMYFCTPCAQEELMAHLTFLGLGNGFSIKYFHPENPNVLPEEDEIKTLKEEEWIIDEKGFFVQL